MREPDYLDDYRPNVGVCVFNPQGQVWLGRRSGISTDDIQADHSYIWQMPQGGIDQGEDIEAAAFRELYEETGIRNVTLLTMTPGWLIYDFPDDYRAHKKRKFKGQRQKWCAMLFHGTDAEVDLDTHDEKEFDEWRWANINETPNLIIPFKKGVYEEVVNSFTPLAKYLQTTSTK